MNPILQSALGAILRHFLTIGAGYLVARGIWSQNESVDYVGAAVLAILGFGWTLYQKYVERQKLLTAIAMNAGSTEAEVEANVQKGIAPPVTTGRNEAPYLIGRPNPPKDNAPKYGGPAIIVILAIGFSSSCATKTNTPTLTPTGKVAYYGEKFLSVVEQAQNSVIKLVADGVVERSSVEPSVRGFVEIGKAGQLTAKALRQIDAATDAVTKAAAAKTVDESIHAIQTILLNITKDVPNAADRDRILAVVNALGVGAALLDMLRAVAPYIPTVAPSGEALAPIAFHDYTTGGFAYAV
jgi:hypothetical protein